VSVVSGCRIILELNVSADELLDIQKAWKMSGVGSLEQYALMLLRGKLKEASNKEEGQN